MIPDSKSAERELPASVMSAECGIWLMIGAAVAGLAVAAGAFGTHGLRSVLSVDRLVTFETAVRYQMYHGLALVALAAFWNHAPGPLLRVSAACWTGGVIVFSGSVYGLALGGPAMLGALAPIGGALFLVGWLSLTAFGFQLFRQRLPKSTENPRR